MINWFRRSRNIDVLTPLEGYNRWAASYQRESNPIKELSDQLITKNLPQLTAKTFLDYGCGTGKFCALAESYGATKIVGIDISPTMIDIAKTQAPKTEFICGDIAEIKLPHNHFDVAISALVLAHVKDLSSTLGSLLESLTEDGTLIISDFHPFLTLSRSKRTFKDAASGKYFEVLHHLHLFEDYFRIFGEHGFVVESLEEPQYNGVPVVFGMRVKSK